MSKAKRGGRAAAWLGPCLGLLMAGAAGAQEAREERFEVSPPAGEREPAVGKRYEPATPPAPETTTALVRGNMAARASTAGPTDASPWKAARWVSLEGDEARVMFANGERRLQVGQTLDGDRVRSVRERQVVLERPARPDRPGGDALVIVDFAEGGSRVRVMWSRDPKAVAPTEPR